VPVVDGLAWADSEPVDACRSGAVLSLNRSSKSRLRGGGALLKKTGESVVLRLLWARPWLLP
jgi:hypothetical protein